MTGKQSDRDWQAWVEIGHRLMECRRRALVQCGRSDLGAPQAKRAMGAILRRERLDRLDKGTRSDLMKCMKHLEDIEAWRHDMDETKRARINFPRTVWAAYQRDRGVANARPRSKRPSAKQTVVLLQQELDTFRKGGPTGGNAIRGSATAEEIVDDLLNRPDAVMLIWAVSKALAKRLAQPLHSDGRERESEAVASTPDAFRELESATAPTSTAKGARPPIPTRRYTISR